MSIDRRSFAFAALSVPVAVPLANAQSLPSANGIDATKLGVRAGGGAEQTAMLQSAIDRAAGSKMPLLLGAGDYRTGELRLPAGAQIAGVRGATRLILTDGAALISARGVDTVTLSGLTFDGGRRLANEAALVRFEQVSGVRITDCTFTGSTGSGMILDGVEGSLSGNTITGLAETAILARDSRGLLIENNTIRKIGNNGIQVWRSAKGDDGTLVTGNRIEDIANSRGGSGQYGNAINVYRAGNVVVRGNRIARVAFSAVRGNAASNLHIADNQVSDAGEVAIYVEFGFEGALVTSNIVDGAALGIVTTNFNEGGRLAVVQGNLIRNLRSKRPAGTDPNDAAGIGIAVEADAAVTGNVIENAPNAGINVGWGHHQRDVAVTGNVVRNVGAGIAVSVANGAGSVVVASNMISGASRGAVLGMDHLRVATNDLARDAARYAHVQVSGNRVR